MSNYETVIAANVKAFSSMNVTELASVYLITVDQAFPVAYRSSLYSHFTTFLANSGIAPEVNAEIIRQANAAGIRL